MMNSIASIQSFFTVVTEIEGAGKIYSRFGANPVHFCQTLIHLNDLEKVLQDELTSHRLVSFLSPDEKKLFAKFTYPKRKREWLGGRLAAKSAVLQLLQINTTMEILAELSILPTETGAPRLIAPHLAEDKLPALSISHSDRFAVAMAVMKETCGIDIQKISEKTERVADRFSAEKELLLLRSHTPWLNEQERLTLLWSAKEALKKALLHDQPVIFQGVILQSVDVGQYFNLRLRFPGDRNRPADITALQLEDCILASTSGNT